MTKSEVWKRLCSHKGEADKATKPLQGDHWINGALTDVKDFEKSPNFSNGFPIFPKKYVSSPSPSTDNGTRKLIDSLVKISSYKKRPLIFLVHQRGV